MLFEEALADARKVREVAEQNAKNAIIDAVTPKIRALIEQQLLDETKDDEDEDDEEDILLGSSNQDDSSDLKEGPEWALDKDTWMKAEKEVDPHGSGKEKNDDPWAVVADVYKKMGGKVKDSEKETMDEEYILNTESIKALSELIKEQNEIEFEVLKLENQFFKLDESDASTRNQINENAEKLLLILQKNSHVYEEEKISNFKNTLENIKIKTSVVQDNVSSITESLVNLKDRIQNIKESKKLNNIQKNSYAVSILKEAKQLCEKINSSKDNLDENEIKQFSKTLDEMSNIYKEIKVMSKGLNEGELKLKLTIPDDIELSADDIDVEVEGAGEEMEMGMDDSMEMEEPGMEMEPGQEDPILEPEAEMSSGMDSMDDDDVVEIDESMLRAELEKIKKLTEVDASALDDFGDGEVVGEPFVDSDDSDLNVNDKKGQSVKKESKNLDGQTKELKSQLAEANEAVEKLRNQLKELNLFNAKLLYTNRLLQNPNLSAKQKVSVVESLDKAKNLREVQLLYKSLTESLRPEKEEKKQPIKESVKRKLIIGSSSKATTSASPTKEDSLNESVELSRWAKLAGITE